ncbi:MAG TPA: nucleotidyl transferase AbiEii/AbiGii toxin family protein [Methanocorpusculum sp.]|nr:nucleotidyl transferase AbiEii/AbiGii toxin family protein [Methanocorpusculum sp.]
MKHVATLSNEERDILFRNTAEKLSLTPAIIEKDFWVCWTLDYLFHQSVWKHSLIFKGGTSLSKAYNLIRRFSEDIDLILDWRELGYDIGEPWLPRSNKKQQEFNQMANARAVSYLKDKMLPVIQEDFSRLLGISADVSLDARDGQTLLFRYPHLYSGNGIIQEIRLEIGPLAAATPASVCAIRPYAAEQYPSVFRQLETDVLTVLPERTFWEKVLILHSEAYRPDEIQVPPRYSRHYYDVMMIAESSVKETAFADKELLKKVIEFKKKFYPLNRARYDLALSGDIHLIPSPPHLETLKADFEKMRVMIFDDVYSFDDIIGKLSQLEDEIRDGTNKMG